MKPLTVAPAAAPLLALCEKARGPLLDLTRQLVNMDSGTHDPEGLAAKARFLAARFAGLGATVELVEAAPPRQGTHNVVATFRGEGEARLLMLTHYDTVFQAGEAARRPFRLEDDVATGPGVADMQSAIASLLMGLDIWLHTLGRRHFHTLTVFCNADEETGSQGSREQIAALAARHHVAFNMEQSGEAGDLITVSGRGIAHGRLTVQGVATHAGQAHLGHNAGYALCEHLLGLRHLSDEARGTAVNWTVARFGEKTNVIPDQAEATADIRVKDPAEFERVARDINAWLHAHPVAHCPASFQMTVQVQPFQNDATTRHMADAVRAFVREELGLELGYRHAIGGNDTSHAAQTCPALDGFGPGCIAMHTDKEQLPLDTLVPRLYILLRAWDETCAGRLLPLRTL